MENFIETKEYVTNNTGEIVEFTVLKPLPPSFVTETQQSPQVDNRPSNTTRDNINRKPGLARAAAKNALAGFVLVTAGIVAGTFTANTIDNGGLPQNNSERIDYITPDALTDLVTGGK